MRKSWSGQYGGLELSRGGGAAGLSVQPCGGGGLLRAVARWRAKHLAPGCRVIGVEPAVGDDARRSLPTAACCRPATIRRRLPTARKNRQPRDLTFAMIRHYVDEMLTVSDDDLVRTLAFV
ncbi:MAG: pyridoxal-phosphate dependent enzyme [Anaerolineae bacterium]|nr:pyridoxal-phosphate dependent enzyme [Anaerolineae bacterium]